MMDKTSKTEANDNSAKDGGGEVKPALPEIDVDKIIQQLLSVKNQPGKQVEQFLTIKPLPYNLDHTKK